MRYGSPVKAIAFRSHDIQVICAPAPWRKLSRKPAYRCLFQGSSRPVFDARWQELKKIHKKRLFLEYCQRRLDSLLLWSLHNFDAVPATTVGEAYDTKRWHETDCFNPLFVWLMWVFFLILGSSHPRSRRRVLPSPRLD